MLKQPDLEANNSQVPLTLGSGQKKDKHKIVHQAFYLDFFCHQIIFLLLV